MTTKTDNGQILIKKAHLSLSLRWAKNHPWFETNLSLISSLSAFFIIISTTMYYYVVQYYCKSLCAEYCKFFFHLMETKITTQNPLSNLLHWKWDILRTKKKTNSVYIHTMTWYKVSYWDHSFPEQCYYTCSPPISLFNVCS